VCKFSFVFRSHQLTNLERSPPNADIPPSAHVEEYQCHLNAIATDKVKKAFQKVQRRCFLEVTGKNYSQRTA
jgi:hypothetical protein